MKMMIEGRELDLDPIAEGGIGVCEAIMLLRAGQPMGWTIEPGDMTRYKVLLIPCWSSPFITVVSGLGPGEADSFILLTYVSPTMPFSQPVGRYCGHWDLTDCGVTNGHTARVLAGLARGVWACLLDEGLDPCEYKVEYKG